MTPVRFRWSLAPALVAALGIALAVLAGCGSDNVVAPLPEPPLSNLIISPASDTLQIGQSRAFTAQAFDTLGAPITTTLHWSSTNTAVFTVNGSGLVSARGEGSAGLVVA